MEIKFSESSGDVEVEWNDGIVILKIYKAGSGITEKLFFSEDELDIDNVIFCLRHAQDTATTLGKE